MTSWLLAIAKSIQARQVPWSGRMLFTESTSFGMYAGEFTDNETFSSDEIFH